MKGRNSLEMKAFGLSLRTKILLALTFIPIVGLSLFLWLTKEIVENDKIAYIKSSNLEGAKAKAARIVADITTRMRITQAVVLSYQSDTLTLADSGKYLFDQEEKFQGFWLFTTLRTDVAQDESSPAQVAEPDSTEPPTQPAPDIAAPNPPASPVNQSQYQRVIALAKDESNEIFKATQAKQDEILKKLDTQSLVVEKLGKGIPVILLAVRFGEATDPNRQIAMAFFEANELSEIFQANPAGASLLLHESGGKIFGTDLMISAGQPWTSDQVWDGLKAQTTPEGLAFLEDPAKKVYLASFVRTGMGDMVVVTLVDRAQALTAIDELLRKSILFFISLLSATVILSVFTSRGLTSRLGLLLNATRQIATGDFAVRIEAMGKDEIGGLATSFNVMAEEVSRLMKETAEKARMESELETARAVQETLFPEPSIDIGTVQISGAYQPASECGGDWWYYFQSGSRVYIFVADATGHGAPASLITSAARAVASIIESTGDIGPAAAMGLMNRAIFDTGKGKMMMTFFIACIDPAQGMITYSNASHEPPMLLHPQEEVADRDSYVLLNEVNGKRLGESPDSTYEEFKLQLQAGDRIVLYTDGVTDVKSPELKAFGERRFVKGISKSLHEFKNTDESLSHFMTNLENYRSQTPLDDDVTVVICQYRGAA